MGTPHSEIISSLQDMFAGQENRQYQPFSFVEEFSSVNRFRGRGIKALDFELSVTGPRGEATDNRSLTQSPDQERADLRVWERERGISRTQHRHRGGEVEDSHFCD